VRRVLRVVVPVAVVIVLATLAALQWQRANDLEDDADERREVATAASAFTSALLSYDAADLDAARARVTELSTPDFAAEYATAFDGGLRAVIDELEAVSTATVRDVFVGDVSGSSARAVVVVDASVRSAAGVRDLTGSYVQVELQLVDGRWLVSAATAVGAEGEAVTPLPESPDSGG
jgi:Mce-associated membrane protein